MPMTTPDWMVAEWLNSDRPLTLSDFQGRIVVLEAFQMLCPGCVAHGLPLLQQVQATFDPADVAVLGLHTVFEHHEAQGSRAALAAFLHEYRIHFPVGIDAQRSGSRLPATMADYEMQWHTDAGAVRSQRPACPTVLWPDFSTGRWRKHRCAAGFEWRLVRVNKFSAYGCKSIR